MTEPLLILSLKITDLSHSQEFARDLATFLRTGDVVALDGDLGAGKTEISRAMIHALGYEEDVPSPTFNLVQTYEPSIDDQTTPAVWHFDLYRLEDAEEIFELGIDEAFDMAISLIEWPSRMGHYLPVEHLAMYIENGEKPEERIIRIYGNSHWQGRLSSLLERWS